MKLADLRKLSIKQQYRIHFRLQNGMECVVTEHGIATVPELHGVPSFNLETELGAAGEFLLEPARPAAGKDAPRPRKATREELSAMIKAPAGAAAGHDEHEDE